MTDIQIYAASCEKLFGRSLLLIVFFPHYLSALSPINLGDNSQSLLTDHFQFPLISRPEENKSSTRSSYALSQS